MKEMDCNGKIAIVSHVVPPDLNGQAVVLRRLLAGYGPTDYCLISTELPQNTSRKHSRIFYISSKLESRNFYIPRFFKFLIEIVNRAKQIRKIVKEERCSVIVACSGDLFDLPAACLASKLVRLPFVPYIFDDYIYQWTGLRRVCAKIFEPLFVKGSHGLIAPNEFLEKEYVKRYGRKVTVIRNPSPGIDEKNDLKEPYYFEEDEINVVYTGSVYHAHFDAFKNLVQSINEINSAGKKISLHIFTPQSKEFLNREGIIGDKVFIYPTVSEAEVNNVLLQATILFLPLAFDSPIPEVIKTSSPGKMGDYLFTGKPILVHAPEDSFVSWFFEKHKCGVVVPSCNAVLLKQRLEELIDNKTLCSILGNTAKEIANRNFSLDVIQARFKELLLNVRG